MIILRTSLVLCLLLIIPLAAQNDMNEILMSDINMEGPGVLARLTPSGTSYVAAVIAKVIATELPITEAPEQINSTQLQSLQTVSFSKMKLNAFQLPAKFHASPLPPNLIAVEMRNINLSVQAYGYGFIDSIPVDTQMDIKTGRFSLDVTIRVNRNSRGNPALIIEKCLVPPGMPVTVTVSKVLTPRSGSRLANAMAAEGHRFFEQIVCPRLYYIINNRINQRLTLLATKITLGETNNFDLVKSILSTTNGFARSVRQDEKPVASMGNLSLKMKMLQQKTQRLMRPQQLHIGAHEMSMLRRQAANGLLLNVHSPRIKRQGDFHQFLNQFNLSRADSLILDYGMMNSPVITSRGIEITQVGEITAAGSQTPFGPHKLTLPSVPSNYMLQIAVSDFIPNSLMYHGHRIGLFNTRVDPNSPQFGPVMRTSCDLSTGSLFCVGDLFPTLREVVPDRGVAFLFSTLRAPAVSVHPEIKGGIQFRLKGLIEILAVDDPISEKHVGFMEIHIEATMKMKLNSKVVKGKVILENIRLISRTPNILVQEELDDAGFLSREILQRMVNDILKQGIPIPVHPLFKLQKPKLTLMERAMLLETNFQLNDKLIRQLTTGQLIV